MFFLKKKPYMPINCKIFIWNTFFSKTNLKNIINFGIWSPENYDNIEEKKHLSSNSFLKIGTSKALWMIVLFKDNKH